MISFRPVWMGVSLVGLLAITVHAGDSTTPATEIRPLMEGPLHEAFLSPSRDRDPVHAPKSPPAAIIERPGVDPPSPDAQWIDGYWQWDDRRNDFVWVTGTWRVAPPGRFWVNGYWKRDDRGWYRVNGFWSDRQTDRIDYRKQGPPADRPEEDPGPAPSDQHFFVPGHYEPDGDGVVWKPGFWAKAQEGWSWVPAQWVQQPEGWNFQAGYWDRNLEDRGILFTPAEVDATADTSNVIYQPLSQVDPDSYARLYGAFGRPTTYYDGYPGCYYDPYGNYYGYANYGTIGLYQGYLDYPILGSWGYPYVNYVSPSYVAAYPSYGYGYGYGYGGRGLLGSLLGSFGFGLGYGLSSPYYGYGLGGYGLGGYGLGGYGLGGYGLGGYGLGGFGYPYLGYGYGSPFFGSSLFGFGFPFFGSGGLGYGGYGYGHHRSHYRNNYPYFPGGRHHNGHGQGQGPNYVHIGNGQGQPRIGQQPVGRGNPGRVNNPFSNLPNAGRGNRIAPGNQGAGRNLAARPQTSGPQVGHGNHHFNGHRGHVAAPASTAYANPFRGQNPNAGQAHRGAAHSVASRPSVPLAVGNSPGFNGPHHNGLRTVSNGAQAGLTRSAQHPGLTGHSAMRPSATFPRGVGAGSAGANRGMVGGQMGAPAARSQPFNGSQFPYSPSLNVSHPRGATTAGQRVQYAPPLNVGHPGGATTNGPAFQYSPSLNVGHPNGPTVNGQPGGLGPQSRLAPSHAGRATSPGLAAINHRAGGASPAMTAAPRHAGNAPLAGGGMRMSTPSYAAPRMGGATHLGAAPHMGGFSGGGNHLGGFSGGGGHMGGFSGGGAHMGGGGHMGGFSGGGAHMGGGGHMGGFSGGGGHMGGGGGGHGGGHR